MEDHAMPKAHTSLVRRASWYILAAALWSAVSLVAVRASNGEDWEILIGVGGVYLTTGPESGGQFIKGVVYNDGIALHRSAPVFWFRTWSALQQWGVSLPTWPAILIALWLIHVRIARRQHPARTGTGTSL